MHSAGSDRNRAGSPGLQPAFGRVTAALIGTSRKPRDSALFAHLAMRASETGSALATPTATPPSRAAASSFASSRSI
jgi:hypothetical protein